MFNTSAINQAIALCFDAVGIAIDARKAYQETVAELQVLLAGADRETIKSFVCPVAAVHYGEIYADGKWGDSKCAAKRYANRVIADVLIGASSPESSDQTVVVPVKLTKAQKDAIAALLAAFGGNKKAAKAAF